MNQGQLHFQGTLSCLSEIDRLRWLPRPRWLRPGHPARPGPSACSRIPGAAGTSFAVATDPDGSGDFVIAAAGDDSAGGNWRGHFVGPGRWQRLNYHPRRKLARCFAAPAAAREGSVAVADGDVQLGLNGPSTVEGWGPRA